MDNRRVFSFDDLTDKAFDIRRFNGHWINRNVLELIEITFWT